MDRWLRWNSGKCYYKSCGNKRLPNASYCAAHGERISRYAYGILEERRAADICQRCGKNSANGKSTCGPCKKQAKELRTTKRKEDLEAGMCTRCHVIKAPEGFTTCLQCRIKNRVIKKKSLEKKLQ